MLRDELGPDVADLHVPLVKRGVPLHKMQSVMHDSCNTANKAARLTKRNIARHQWTAFLWVREEFAEEIFVFNVIICFDYEIICLA
jgi:hypothetical protein